MPIILDPTTQKFIDKLTAQGGPPIYTLSVSDARKVLEAAQAIPVEMLEAEIEEATLLTGVHDRISIRIVCCKGAPDNLPVVMYFHGGGWILGSFNTHERLVREIAHGAQAAVVFVEYTPSPEARFPVAIEQAYAATKYIAERGDEFGLDGSHLAVAGDSVGGNMAAVVAQLAKARGGPRILQQVMLYPVTDAGMSTASYQEFAGGPWLTKAAMEWFWNAYAPDPLDRIHPEVSPLQASVDQLRDLPPALIVTDENDVLRDEGEAYAQKLMRAGVSVTAVRCLGTIHDFAMLNALADTPATRCAISMASHALHEALYKPSLAMA